MSVAKKVVECLLDPKSIGRAMREVEKLKRETAEKAERLAKLIAERIAQTAQSGFGAAVVDDLLNGGPRSASVDVSVDSRGKVSVVIASGKDAVWVEFGAGVYHNGAAGTSPHPRGGELGLTIGSYGEGRGARNVWGYYNADGDLTLTHGTPASMPMYSAMQAVCAEIADIAREVWK